MKNKTETLDEWLISQIKRGCTLESIIATKQEGGYALTIAQNYVVNAFVAAGKLMPSDLNQPIQSLDDITRKTNKTRSLFNFKQARTASAICLASNAQKM